MARAPDPRIEQAKERYLAGEKLTEIARQLGLPEGTVRRWKCTHKWDKTDSERSDRAGDKQCERSDRNEKKEKRKRGAQPGNKNSSGGPPGNKKAITTGEFETLLFDCLKEEELRLVASTPKDKHRLLLQEIQLISVRERRMLRRIEDIKESLEYLGRNGSEEGLTLVMVEDGEKGINKKYEGKLGQIQSIEEALTRVQAKKQRMIEALHKFGYDDAYMKLQLKRLEQDKTDSKTDAVKVWAEKVLEARRERVKGENWLEEFLGESIPLWKEDPVLFMREVLLFEPDDWQIKVAYDLRDYPRVTVKSGQGVGKTGEEAALLLWFLVCFPYPRIVATAPTKQQLHDVLWSEVDKWMNNSPLLPMLLKWTKTHVYMIGYEKRWFAVARTATKPENMQGFHEDNMLFIVDEASGVADPIMEAITGTLAGANNKLLLMGNPTKTSGTFYESHTADRALYRCHTVNAEHSKRTNKENIDAMKRKYGERSNVVRVRVYGEFPEQEDDVFIPISFLEQSIKTEMSEPTARAFGKYRDSVGNLQPADVSGVELIEIGCDVARFGDDKTCIGYRVNEVVQIYKKYNGKDTTWTASMIARLYKELKQRFRFQGQIGVKVDDGGVGGGVVDQLRNWKRSDPEVFGDMAILAVNFGEPIKHRYYADSTTYMMGVLRDLIAPYDDSGRPHVPEVILPDDSDLIGQLSCRKFEFCSNGKQKVESKQDMKDRGLSSPDEGDCILLVCLPMNYKKKGGKS